jgi:putative membrane-bound dehydrogenase-like protein
MNVCLRLCLGLVALVQVCDLSAMAQTPKPVIPHAQDKPPNDPRDPEAAAKMMTVPDGFSVEVVAAEPDIVNPVAMTIDEQGRFWITESLEYPRREPGPGKDRVKILEDTDGDGKMDKFTVFMDGLNIPSGIAVGHGGVWVANSPDILFVQDTDGDGKADKQEVVVTGFGRTDTHELPNSLTWGPDGWLYGLNGVFNHSHVKYAKTNPNYKVDHKGWPLTCAMFRIHPRTREFQVFCEGTSNPWGIAFNNEGDAFISACVIDHLWHLVETGYYHRQGGPYPPFTWKIESIVKHKHQKAAYCGIHYFDSDAYPEKYRGKLYMGNIHGGCINVDRIERSGSTYKGFGEDDFLTANDAWFMPVVQKTGPDGSLYILDWYDRYHCYQDANRDPAGIDRLKGRLYRVRYKDTPRAPKGLDLSKETDDQLIERLSAKNDWTRWTATRLLQERVSEETRGKLQRMVKAQETSGSLRRQAYFALIGIPRPKGAPLASASPTDDAVLLAWEMRCQNNDPEYLAKSIQDMSKASSMSWDGIVKLVEQDNKNPLKFPPVLLQWAIGTSKNPHPRNAFGIWMSILALAGEDPLIPRVVWQNMHPRLEDHPGEFVDALADSKFMASKQVVNLLPRVVDRILGRQHFDPQPIAKLFSLIRDEHPEATRDVLGVIAAKVQSGELKGEKLDQLRKAMFDPLTPVLESAGTHPLGADVALLAVSWGDKRGVPHVRQSFATRTAPIDQRLKALNALVAAHDEQLIDWMIPGSPRLCSPAMQR